MSITRNLTQPLTRAITRSLTQAGAGGGGAFSLVSALFGASEPGFYYDVQDLENLSQDTGGATPVTAVGQPVGRITDLSGNGNHGTCTNCTLGQDAYGCYYIDATAPGAIIDTPSMDFTSATQVFAAFSYIKQQTGVGILFEFGPNASQAAGTFGVWGNDAQPVDHPIMCGTANAYEYQETAFGYVGDPNVWACRFNLAGATIALRERTRRFGESITGGTGGAGYAATANFSTQAGHLCARAGGGVPLKCYLYGALVRAAPTADDAVIGTEDVFGGFFGMEIPRTSGAQPVSALKAVAVGDSTVAAFTTGLPQSNVLDLAGFTSGVSLAEIGHTIAQQKAAWIAAANKNTYDAVIVQVGINDLQPSNSFATIRAAYQDLIDQINADVSVPVIISTMTPCRLALVDAQGAIDGAASYVKWQQLNEAIRGEGATPITGVDGRISAHTPLLDDRTGALYYAFNNRGDNVHPGDNGRQIYADLWRAKLVELGLSV